MSKSKIAITEKHIDALGNQNIVLIAPLGSSGTFKGQFYGKISGRLRTRFKQYIFVPNMPFTSFYFSLSDIEKIEEKDGIFILNIGTNPASEAPIKRKRRKNAKAKLLPAIDLNSDNNEVIELSPQATPMPKL